MDPKRCDTFGSIAWVLVIGGLLILAMVFLDIMHTARLDTNVAICALLALGGPLFASIISRIVLRNDQSSENDRYYKIWRIDTLVYLYMMLMACISFAMFIEALSDAAVKHGMARADAYRMVSQMIVGTGRLQLETGQHPGAMKDAVCSPGGTTIVGVAELERKGFRGAVIAAIDAIQQKK